MAFDVPLTPAPSEYDGERLGSIAESRRCHGPGGFLTGGDGLHQHRTGDYSNLSPQLVKGWLAFRVPGRGS